MGPSLGPSLERCSVALLAFRLLSPVVLRAFFQQAPETYAATYIQRNAVQLTKEIVANEETFPIWSGDSKDATK